MTRSSLVTADRTTNTAACPGRSLEELVDRLMKKVFSADLETPTPTPTPTPVRATHEARRFSQTREIDGTLSMLAGMNMSGAETRQTLWAFTEWKQLVKRRFGDRGALT